MEGGWATLPLNLVPPPSIAPSLAEPQPWSLPIKRGAPGAVTSTEHVSAPHPQIQRPRVVHESPQYILAEESPPPPPQANPVGPITPLRAPRQGAYIQHMSSIPYLTRRFRGGCSGGGHSSGGGALGPVAARPTPSFEPAGQPSDPSVAGGSAPLGGRSKRKASKTGAKHRDKKVWGVPQEHNTYTLGGCSQLFEIHLAKHHPNCDRCKNMWQGALNANFIDGMRLLDNALVRNGR